MSQLQVTGEAKIRDIQGPVVANSGVITALDGAASQYVRGDGTLADFPTSSGGGSSVSYYLNSSVSQGTIGGVAYRELSKEPIIGAGTDIAIAANGYVASYLTDANDPDVLSIPGGNFNCEFYFSVNNDTGNPFFYAELYKYDGTTFTLLGSSVGVPEYINQGTIIAPYYFAIPVPTSALALTDRLAIRIYVNVDGRTVTLHTENSHLCQVVTTLSKGMVSLNNLTDQSQYITTGTSGTDFNIVSSGDTHTFNLPIASATNTGKLSSTDWSTFNNKVPYTGANANVDLGSFELNAILVKAITLEAKLNGTASGNLVLRTGTNGYGFGNNAFSLASSPDYDNTLLLISNKSAVTKTALFNINYLTADRTYTFPDATGTIALTSDLSSYVPYIGATANVDLGGNSLYFNNGQAIFGRNFTGTTAYALIGVNPSNKVSIDTSALGAVFGGDVTGISYIANGLGSQGGTIALKQNGLMSASTGYTTLGSLSAGQLVIYFGDSNLYAATFLNTSLTDSRSYTLPNISGTLALLEGTQTFTGIKTFSENPIINGTGTNSAYTILQSAGTNKWRIGNNYAAGVNTFDIFAYDNSSTPLSINSNGAMTLSANVTTTGAQFVQNGFYLTNANGGSLAGYTHMWARNEGINFGLRNGTGGASFIFPSANSYNYTFPAASGTLALSSDLSAYLPLAGGTLTGALSGTSATFSSTLSAMSSNIQFNLDGTFGTNYYTMGFGGVSNGFNRISGGTGTTDGLYITSATGRDIVLRTNGTGSNVLVLASTGAATFSSSVTAGGNIQTSGGANTYFKSTGFISNQLGQLADFGGSDSGFYVIAGGGLQFVGGGANRMTLTSGGNVGIGTSSPSALLHLVQNTTNLNLYLQNTSGSGKTWAVNSDSNGSFNIHDTTANRLTVLSNGITLIYSVYSQTSGAAANVIVGSDGNLFRSTSSLKYKKNVNDYTKGLAEVMQLRPVTYNGINELDGYKEYAGLIAEEVHELGLTEFVQYAEDGTPDALAYQNMIALLVKGMQEQQAQIEQLKAMIAAK